MKHCMTNVKNDMSTQLRGPLSFLILWIIYKKSSRGCDITQELKKRRGNRPSPGTVYPILKDLVEKKSLHVDKNLFYTITQKGEKDIIKGCKHLSEVFYDFDEMKKILNKSI